MDYIRNQKNELIRNPQSNADIALVVGSSVCGNCGHLHDDSMSMNRHEVCDNGDAEWWCSDCMRQNNLCQGCDKMIWCNRCEADECDTVPTDHECNERMCPDCGGD